MGRHAAPHTPQTPSHTEPNPTYEKAPRRTTTFPAVTQISPEAPRHNAHRARNEATSTRVTIPTAKPQTKTSTRVTLPTTKTQTQTKTTTRTKLPTTKTTAQQKTPTQKPITPTPSDTPNHTKTPQEILNTLNDPALLAALTILLVGIILTGISWGWLYAGAIALVTLGFIATYTTLYTKNNTPPPSE